MDDRILAVTAYPITGGSCGNLQVTAPVIKPSFRGRMFKRSMALESVQVSNCLSLSSSPLRNYRLMTSIREQQYMRRRQ